MKNTASTEAAGCRIDGAQDAKNEILDEVARKRKDGSHGIDTEYVSD